VGTVYQDFRLVGSLRVVHNVSAGHLGRWPCWKALVSLAWPQERETARRALAQVGLADKLDATTAALSGGEQQRVALARVLVQDPQLVVADEPISSLDPARAREIMDLLRAACVKGGKTLVASCHTTAFARTHFGRAVGLRAGRIAFDCPSEELTDGMLRELYHIEPAVAVGGHGDRVLP
jgi:phosphonate transport system ATP-binding protein